MKGNHQMKTTTTTSDYPRAVEAAINCVKTRGAVTFMELHDHLSGRFGLPVGLCGDEVMTVGNRSIGDRVTQTPMSDPPNVVLWNCGSPDSLAGQRCVDAGDAFFDGGDAVGHRQ
jgi:hypothetical protein